jgi:hypothetical protein
VSESFRPSCCGSRRRATTVPDSWRQSTEAYRRNCRSLSRHQCEDCFFLSRKKDTALPLQAFGTLVRSMVNGPTTPVREVPQLEHPVVTFPTVPTTENRAITPAARSSRADSEANSPNGNGNHTSSTACRDRRFVGSIIPMAKSMKLDKQASATA